VGERLSEYPETGWLYAAVLQAGRAGRIVPRLYTYIHSDNDDSVTSGDLEHPQKNMTENPEFSQSLCSSWYNSLQFAFTESFELPVNVTRYVLAAPRRRRFPRTVTARKTEIPEFLHHRYRHEVVGDNGGKTERGTGLVRGTAVVKIDDFERRRCATGAVSLSYHITQSGVPAHSLDRSIIPSF